MLTLDTCAIFSGTLGIWGMNRERKWCPWSSWLPSSRDFEIEMYSINGEGSLGVLEAAGKDASVSVDSGTDKIKSTCPKGTEKSQSFQYRHTDPGIGRCGLNVKYAP